MRVDGYIRVSRVGQRAGERFISPAQQRDAIGAWAAQHNAVLLNLFEELDESGARAERPLLARAIWRIEAGISEGLVVAYVDRFGRSLIDGLLATDRITKAGGGFYVAEHGIDADTEFGRHMLRLMLSWAEWERDRTRAAWRDAQSRAIRRGVYIAATVPVGYRRTRAGRLRPDPKTADVVADVFRRRVSGERTVDLARHLEQNRVRTALGNPGWSGEAVRRLLHNRVYTGEVHFGSFVRSDAHEPIVDAATWELAQRAYVLPKPHSPALVLLAGLARCAGCGMRMHASPRQVRGATVRDFVCQRRFSSGTCPHPAWVSNELLEPYVVDVVFDLLRHRRQPPRAMTEAAEERLVTAQAALDRYRDSDRVLLTLGPESFASGVAQRQDRVRQRRLELAEASARCEWSTLPSTTELEARWAVMPFDERRRVVTATIDCLFVASGRERIGERVTVCPVGTAPRDLRRPGDPRGALRRYGPRRQWVNPGQSDLAHGAWSRLRLERELRAFTRGHSSWPAAEVFLAAGRDRLLAQARRQGGEAVWAYRVGLPIGPSRGPQRAWTDDRIRAGLQVYLEGKHTWPTGNEFERDGVRLLRRAITTHGGAHRWASEFDITWDARRLRPRANRYWTDERIAERLRTFCKGRSTFPTQREFREAGASALLKAAQRYHGVKWWAESLNVDPPPSFRRTRRGG